MTKTRIKNIVASTQFADSLDLTTVTMAQEGAEYKPELFPGLTYRLKEPKTALLFFRNWKANCTGGKSMDDFRKSINNMVNLLDKAGFTVYKDPEIEIHNIIAVYDQGCELWRGYWIHSEIKKTWEVPI